MGEIFKLEAPRDALEFTGERLTSGIGGQIEVEHFHRYFFARNLARGLAVLDVACGEGYGSAYLSQVAASVIGVDIDDPTIEHARENYGRENLEFRMGSALDLPIATGSIDLVVSFETIEHFYDHDKFLSEIKRVLRPNGLFIVSTPERDLYSPPNASSNPFHVRELTEAEFHILLSSHFANVGMLKQRLMMGSVLVPESGLEPADAITVERRGGALFEVSVGMPRAPYIIAIASNGALPAIGAGYYMLERMISEDDLATAQKQSTDLGAETERLNSELAFALAVSSDRAARIEELELAVAAISSKYSEAASRVSTLDTERDALATEREATMVVLNDTMNQLAVVQEEYEALTKDVRKFERRPFRAAGKLFGKSLSRLWRRN